MKKICEECKGTGKILPYGNLGEEHLNYFSKEECYVCKGKGKINENK